MPPVSEIQDALVSAVLPSVVTACLVFVVIGKLTSKRYSVAAGAIALASAFVVGNAFRGAVEFRLDSERLLTPAALGQAVLDTLDPPQGEDAPIPPPTRYWIPWSAALALLGGLLTFRLKPSLQWPICALLAVLAALLAVPAEIRTETLWSVPVLSAVILGEWFVLERLASVEEHFRHLPALAGMFVFGGASIVLLHAHSARFVDIATIVAASLSGIVLVAWLIGYDSIGVVPGIAVALPCLMLAGQQDTFSNVPTAGFVLIAAAPLALAPLLVERVRRRLRPTISWLVGVVLLCIPVVVAIALAVANESLSFE